MNSVLKILKKPQKYNHISSNFKDVLQLLGLDYSNCHIILSSLSSSYEKYQNCPIVLDILTYTLRKISTLCEKNSKLKPLSGEIVLNLTSYFVGLCRHQEAEISNISLAFLDYFKIFPHNIKNIDKELFESIVQLTDINKDNVSLAVFLLEKVKANQDYVVNNSAALCEKKGLILPFLKVLVKKEVDDKVLESIYEKFDPFLSKALQKPQKAGQHFHQNYEGLLVLIKKIMPAEKCKSFCSKVQKYEVSEVFHAKLLSAICFRALREGVDEKNINSIILTYVHLQVNVFKRNLKTVEDIAKVQSIASTFNDILETLKPLVVEMDLKNTSKNDSLKLYCKFCLKFGVSGQALLLKTLSNLLGVLGTSLDEEDGRNVMEMLVSHSEFLEGVLGDHSEVKEEILALFLVLCPSYRATIHKCDRIILELLKMYESKSEQTNFYDFKPFLWGRVAANHYSVRFQIENSLWRQPKMGDVLDILNEDYVRSTIVNYPRKEHLLGGDSQMSKETEAKSYDLMFLLPLFSQLLAPEQQVQTYKFTRSGALSLSVIGLSSDDEEVRKAACHVLARFYYHVDARQSGKDNLLWIRYIEAVCKGTAILPNFKLNNFAAIYLAKMALILTQPNHIMYLPLSQHLTAKSALDFSTVPELYTFLHSSDINFKAHRSFILELLKDGLRTEKDLLDFMKSMAFKLFSELYSSSASDSETKLLIWDVVGVICRLPLGVKILCESGSFLTQLYDSVSEVLKHSSKDSCGVFIGKIAGVVLSVVRVMQDKHTNFMVYNIARVILSCKSFTEFVRDCAGAYFEIIHTVQSRFPEFFSKEFIGELLSKTDDSFSKYLFEYGCEFVSIDEGVQSTNVHIFLRRLTVNLMKKSAL
ncbi:hypothetical protein JTB14_037773 [Gonioctena quinquepunctata]|nr:hypothetical protein JTB14_037773 [Gonioctena quinquepunctata]